MDQSRRQARLERNRAQQRQGQLKWLIYISIAAVVVVALLILANQVKPAEARTYNQKSGTTIGDPNAPVHLVEIADMQCPFCHQWYSQVEQQIIETYVDTGQVYFTIEVVGFLDSSANGESTRAAQAAYCAADQNMFWEYHGVVYTNQSGENQGAFRDDRLQAFANSLELDMNAFNSCLNSNEKAADVQAAEDYASSHGIQNVPSFVVNDQDPPYIGLQTFDQLSAILDAAIAAAGSN
jgi:protein-disulfide isomerase